jgi:hypothetical protein
MALIKVSAKLKGETITVDVSERGTVLDLKKGLCTAAKLSDAKLLFKGKTLLNDTGLVEAGLKGMPAVWALS